MLLKDSIVIDASPDKVWKLVGSPDLWGRFHAKVNGCELVSAQGGRVGSVYTIGFQMGTVTTPTRCEIVDVQPGAMIQVRSTDVDPHQPGISATLTYELDDRGSRTRVRERVEFVVPGVNVFFRAIIWLISRFGSPQGETTLKKLKRVAEGS